MNRPIETIKDELSTVNIRLNGLIAESELIERLGKEMFERKTKLMIELEEAKNS